MKKKGSTSTDKRENALIVGGLYLIAAVALQFSGSFLGVWMIVALLCGVVFAVVAQAMNRVWHPVFYYSLCFSLFGGIVALLLAKGVKECKIAAEVKETPAQPPVFFDAIEEAEWKAEQAAIEEKLRVERDLALANPPPAPAGWKDKFSDNPE